MQSVVKEGIVAYIIDYEDQLGRVITKTDNLCIRLENSNMTPSTMLQELRGIIEESLDDNFVRSFKVCNITVLNIIWLN